MPYMRYWTERDTFLRRQAGVLEKDWLREKFHNAYFSVFRLKDGRYALSNYKLDDKAHVDVICIADKSVIRDLINDPDGWTLFYLRAENDGKTVLLNNEGKNFLSGLSSVKYTEDAEDPFEAELAEATEHQEEISRQEKIVGTPEWRKSVEREVHALVEEDRKRTANYSGIRKLFLEPSVRRRLKNENEYVNKEMNRRIYEAMAEQREQSEGSVSASTVKAGIFAVVGIALAYLLIALRMFDLAFVPALIGGVVSLFLLIRDDNSDVKNMNARLIVWIVTILCLIVCLVNVSEIF